MRRAVWLLVLGLVACGSVPRAPVQDRSPVLPREITQPTMPGAAPSGGTPPLAPPRTAEKPPPRPPSGPSYAGMAAPQTTGGTGEDPIAVTTPLRGDSERATQAPSRMAALSPTPPAGRPPAATPAPSAGAQANGALPPLAWGWPVDTPITQPYNDTTKGIDFSGAVGQPVRAAASGTVTYVGNSLRGYGWMIVVKHDNGYLSVYAHNKEILAKKGQRVERGQRIAEMGNSDSKDVTLHFEVRHQGRPVDPTQLLPAR